MVTESELFWDCQTDMQSRAQIFWGWKRHIWTSSVKWLSGHAVLTNYNGVPYFT